MKNTVKPAIVPTVLSSRGTLWSVLLVGYFLALFWAYDVSGKMRAVREELGQPVATRIETPLTALTMPAGWAEYAVSGDTIEMRRDAGKRVPSITLVAARAPRYAYQALDENPAILLKRADAITTAVFGENKSLAVIGRRKSLVTPECKGILAALDVGEFHGGAGLFFYHGDVCYTAVGVWADTDAAAQKTITDYFSAFARHAKLPARREAIERPSIDSSKLRPEEIRRVLSLVEREQALWRLYRDRAKLQPEAYTVQAISHFRLSLEQLSSIREEDRLLREADYRDYLRFFGSRAKVVREWFVRLDKLIAMRDIPAARKQAQFIVKHATLVDEALDRRRAQDILARLGGDAQ